MDVQSKQFKTQSKVSEDRSTDSEKQSETNENELRMKETEQKQQERQKAEEQTGDSSPLQQGLSETDSVACKKPKTRRRGFFESLRRSFRGKKEQRDASDARLCPKTERKESLDAKIVRTSVPINSEAYHMKHKRRGVALIFNHINFKKMASRKGSIKDSKDLTQTLNRLGFEIREYVDPTVQTISSILKVTAAEDHTDADCLVVVTMSHGESGLLYSADNVYPVDMLWAHFTGDRCSTLVGKPKLFFIQACRGSKLENGVQVMHETDGASSYTIPTHADIMVAYSTFDGFYSWRNPDAGSWFIQALCEELNENGRTRDLLTIMTFVNRRVAIQYQSFVPNDQHFHQKKQIPSIVSMLTRLVYFGEKPL
ncbi:caspase-1-like isoform X1 [Nomia melanderi]|uniref:caspase-1-like isoform X1 n=1 Tax=Nomia melanderi TaxID=2448451 RepID=UPI0013040104|nr:caspase-1-like isoform X1 [Nomia melanderi]